MTLLWRGNWTRAGRVYMKGEPKHSRLSLFWLTPKSNNRVTFLNFFRPTSRSSLSVFRVVLLYADEASFRPPVHINQT